MFGIAYPRLGLDGVSRKIQDPFVGTLKCEKSLRESDSNGYNHCDSCGVAPIIGTQYKCSQCPGVDLCESCLECFERGEYHHGPFSVLPSEQHFFVRVPPTQLTVAGWAD